MLVEIIFIASAFQCGGSAPQAQFEVYANNDVALEVGEKTYVHVESIEDLQFGYSVISDGDCALHNIPGIIVNYGDVLPDNIGAFDQPSLIQIIDENVTNEYLSVVLWELGTTNTESSAYDLQDIVIQINTNPTPFAD